MTRTERAGLILMEKLEMLQLTNYSIRAREKPKMYSMTSELGIVGYFLDNAQTLATIENVQRDHMLRSKAAEAREGGVRIAMGLHDSPYLF